MIDEHKHRAQDDELKQASQDQMPRYRCHKVVSALKIVDVINETDGSRVLVPAEKPFSPFKVDNDYVRKHNPQPGGYYVVYSDGYKSFSPAKAFEEGYTRICES